MINFSELSSFLRALFAFWSLMLCIVYITNIVLSASRRRYVFLSITSLLFVAVYFLWQMIFDLSLFKGTDKLFPITAALTNVAWIWWLLLLLGFTIIATVLFINNVKHEKNNITPNSIKICLDNIHCGVCCYQDSGRVLFSNVLMNELCNKLTGSQLLDGNKFASLLNKDIIKIDDTLWHFTSQDMVLNNEHLHEVIASDITSEYKKTEDLQKDRIKLSKINEELKEYNLIIDDVVRHKEILQAKINIHNEMNKLMLSTIAAGIDDSNELDNIFAMWEQNVLLLNQEVEDIKEENEIKHLEELAKALNITLEWTNNLLQLFTKEQRALFFFASYEAITNAVKHAKASELTISFKETGNTVDCLFTNDGIIPQNNITFSGGLINLKRILEREGATISYQINDKFTLIISFDKKNAPNG